MYNKTQTRHWGIFQREVTKGRECQCVRIYVTKGWRQLAERRWRSYNNLMNINITSRVIMMTAINTDLESTKSTLLLY